MKRIRPEELIEMEKGESVTPPPSRPALAAVLNGTGVGFAYGVVIALVLSWLTFFQGSTALAVGMGIAVGGVAGYYNYRFRHLDTWLRWSVAGGATGALAGALAADFLGHLWLIPYPPWWASDSGWRSISASGCTAQRTDATYWSVQHA